MSSPSCRRRAPATPQHLLAPLVRPLVLACAPMLALGTPAAALAQDKAEPAVKQTVLEDDGVRIEETRVRGQVTRVVVRSKQADVKAYELLVGNAARDPSQRGQASGQRVWHILSF